MDRREPLHDHLLPRHAQGPAGECDGRDHRQELGGEAHRERHGEQQRIEERPPQRHAHDKDAEDESERHPGDQQPEGPQITLERRGAFRRAQGRGGGAEHGRAAGPGDESQGLPALAHRSAEKGVRGLRWALRADGAGMLLDWIRLAGQRGLRRGESRALQDQGVGGHDVARAHPDQVARHEALDGDRAEAAVAPSLRRERHGAAQCLGRADRVALLQRFEADREREDRDDDQAPDPVTGEDPKAARGDQGEGEGFEQPAQDGPHTAAGRGQPVGVRPITGEPPRRLRCGQAVEPASEPDCEGGGRTGPERGRGRSRPRRRRLPAPFVDGPCARPVRHRLDSHRSGPSLAARRPRALIRRNGDSEPAVSGPGTAASHPPSTVVPTRMSRRAARGDRFADMICLRLSDVSIRQARP